MARALIVEIFGNAKQFGAELDRAAGKTRQLSKAAGVAGLALAGGLAIGLTKSVQAAMEDQVSQELLATALKNTHQSLTAMKPALDQAGSAARKLGFSDDEATASLAKLVTATGDTGKAIKDLGLAEDIARFKHTDLDSATRMLTSTLAGNARAAKQLGIIVQPTTGHMDALKEKYKQLGKEIPPAEKAQAAFLDKQATGAKTLQLVTDKVHGQAKAFAGTAAGGMAQFRAQLDNLEQTLGKGLLPAVTVVAEKLASLFGFFAAHTTTTKIMVAALGGLAATLIAVSVASSLAAAGAGIAAAATGVWTAAQWLLNAALAANPIGLVIVGLVALGAALVLAYKHSETFRDIVAGAFNVVKTVAEAVANFVTVKIPAAFNAILNWVRSNWPIIAVLISGPFAPLVALATNAFGVRSALVNAFEAVKNAVTGTLAAVVTTIENKFGQAIAAIRNRISDATNAATSIGRAILTGLETGITGIVSGVEGKLNAVLAVIRGLPGRIVGALGDLSHLLYNAGSSIIQGLIDGLTSKLRDVENLASSIAGKIAHLKGPIDVDRKLLVPHGQAIIQGLQAGMESGLASLYGSVSGIAPNIQATAGGGLAAGGAGGGTNNYYITFPNYIGDRRELDEYIRSSINRAARRGSVVLT